MADGANGPVAILAGGGGLPLAVAETLRAQGREARVIAFRGFADRALRRRCDQVVDLLDVKAALAALARWRPSAVALAGVVHRPKPLAVMNAFAAFRNRAHIADLLGSGDDRLLGGVVRMLEDEGFRVVGLDELAPQLLAPRGLMGLVGMAEEESLAADRGFLLLSALSSFDVGQAAVVRGARIVAIEGAEGTDAMLARVRGFRPAALMHRRAAGVLVKTAKAGQDLRIDMPVIGPRTIARAAAANLAGIAVGAGRTLILDRPATVAEADRRGLFLVGIEAPSAPGISPDV